MPRRFDAMPDPAELTTAFDRDGWGRHYGLNVASRTVFSAGPDGLAEAAADNIPPGVGP